MNLVNKYEQIRTLYQQNFESKFSSENLFEYNEVLFSAHSCAIEGNSFSVNDTRELKEHGLKLKLNNKTMIEAFEILDHFKAFEFLMKDLNKPLSENLLIQVHKILTKNTISYTKGAKPGEYTNSQMAAGDTIFPDYKESIKSIPNLMNQTEAAIIKAKVHPVELSAKFHQFFIYLHPFPDGNGRIGRLFSNYILARLQHPLIIITKADREEYINSLKACHKHKDTEIITSFFFKMSISRIEDELQNIQNKIPNTDTKKGKGMNFVF
jgi:Fic family protein